MIINYDLLIHNMVNKLKLKYLDVNYPNKV